jgi:ribosomal protein L11 methyltransferase
VSNTPSTFFVVKLYSVPAEFEDVITGHGFDYGATGVSESLAFTQPDLTYEPEIVNVRKHDLELYFPEKPKQAFFDQLKEWSAQIRWEVSEETNKDWLAEWKKGFNSFQLIGPYWIVPSWLTPPPEAGKIIKIDPGMAFGTGTHATTKMAAYFVHKISAAHQNLDKKSLIDVGTGTAILAMLAKQEGIGTVKGIEIDPEARRVAKENIKLNDLNSIEISDQLIEQVKESYDFVVANIIDGILIQIKNDLLRVLKPGGELFLTGVLLEREEIFTREFLDKAPLKLIRRIEKDEWVGYWMQQSE